MKKLSSLLVLIFCLIPFVASAWILRDEFNTALSAGSVHNTTSEPSGHTRTVTDTENKLSIADGKLTFSGGKASPAWGDPAIWYPSVARAAGVSIILDITPTDATTSAEFGFDSGQSGNIVGNAMRITGDTIITYDGSTAGSSIFIPANATNYQLATILRSAGAYYFLKGGTATKWSMLWAGGADNTTPLYPGIANYDLASTNSFLRIHTTLWLPSPLASDGFSVSGTTDGKGHAEGVATGIGEGGGGLAWQSGGSTWSVSGGKMKNTPTVGATLWDTGADTFESGTYGWVKYGNNTVENDNGKLKITYVDNEKGAYNLLKEQDSDLSQDLTVGQWYMFTADMMTAQTEQGDAVYINDGGTIMNLAWMTSNTMTPYNISFKALSTNGSIIYIGIMAAGDVFSMDNISLKPLTLSTLINTVQTSTPDIIATINASALKAYGVWGGVALNVDSATDPQNMVLAIYNNYTLQLIKMVNGVYTTLISESVNWVSGAELRVIKDGTTYRVYYNNALIGTATISDESIINNTRHGLFSSHPGDTLDNFTLYARGTGGEYNILNQLMSTNTGGSLNLLGVGK
jgi:hypothetical protein